MENETIPRGVAMISSWKKKKLTLVIIPEANRSVIRLRLPRPLLYMIAVAVPCMIVFSAVVYMIHAKTLLANERLLTELNERKAEFDRTIAGKNDQIQQLQNEVIELSQQADEVRQKMEEIKKLEDDLRSISGMAPASGKTVASAAPVSDGQEAGGLGGALYPVSAEEIDRLSEHTKAAYDALSDQMKLLQESLSTTKKEILQKQHLLARTPSIWPVNSRQVTSGFGYRKDPFTFEPSFHKGLDISAPLNDPVYATADGVVVFTGYDKSHGYNIIIDHSYGIRTWYMHLNKIVAKTGDTVKKGQKIGLVGSTGRSTGSHLHYEVVKNGVSVDPKPYLR